MKISKQKLKQIILEEFDNMNEIMSSTYDVGDEQYSTKITPGVKSGQQFAQDRKQDALDVNDQISNNEREILKQVDDFLLKLAAIEGVELNNNRPQIEQVLSLLKTRIADKALDKGEKQ